MVCVGAPRIVAALFISCLLAACGGGGGGGGGVSTVPVAPNPPSGPQLSPTTQSTAAPLTINGGTVSLGGVSNAAGTANAISSATIVVPTLSAPTTATIGLSASAPGGVVAPQVRSIKVKPQTSLCAAACTLTPLAYFSVSVNPSVSITQSPHFTATFPSNVSLTAANAYVVAYSSAIGPNWIEVAGPVTANGNTLDFPSAPVTPSPLTLLANTTYYFAIVTTGSTTITNAPTQATLSFTIPSVGPSARRRPAYAPSSVQAIAGTINGKALSSTPVSCSAPGCTVTLSVPPGSDTFDLSLYGIATQALAHTTLTQNMPEGVTTQIHPTFHGIVSSATVTADTIYPLAGTSKTVNLSIVARDADGNTINGDAFDTPVTVALASPSPHITLPSDAAFTSPSNTIAVAYDGHNVSLPPTFSLTIGGTATQITPFFPDSFQSFAVSTPVTGVAIGANGTTWFVACAQGNSGPCHPGSISSNGTIAEYAALPGMSFDAAGALGPDGNMWFTAGDANPLGISTMAYAYRVTPSGTETSFPLHSLGANQAYEVYALAAGPDGNMWVAEMDRIDRITMNGNVTTYPLNGWNRPRSMVAGPDGRMWFDFGYQIAAITANGVISYYPVQSGVSSDITFGNDGNLYFVTGGIGLSGSLEKMSTSGTETVVTTNEIGFGTSTIGLATGNDGNLWGTLSPGYPTSLSFNGNPATGPILTSQTTNGQVTYYYAAPNDNAQMFYRVSKAADGSLWSAYGNYVTRFIWNP